MPFKTFRVNQHGINGTMATPTFFSARANAMSVHVPLIDMQINFRTNANLLNRLRNSKRKASASPSQSNTHKAWHRDFIESTKGLEWWKEQLFPNGGLHIKKFFNTSRKVAPSFTLLTTYLKDSPLPKNATGTMQSLEKPCYYQSTTWRHEYDEPWRNSSMDEQMRSQKSTVQ